MGKEIELRRQSDEERIVEVFTFGRLVEELSRKGKLYTDSAGESEVHVATFDLNNGQILTVKDAQYISFNKIMEDKPPFKSTHSYYATLVNPIRHRSFLVMLRDGFEIEMEQEAGDFTMINERDSLRFRFDIVGYANLKTGEKVWAKDIEYPNLLKPVKNIYSYARQQLPSTFVKRKEIMGILGMASSDDSFVPFKQPVLNFIGQRQPR